MAIDKTLKKRPCRHCGKEFMQTRWFQVFCTNVGPKNCKWAWWNEQNPRVKRA